MNLTLQTGRLRYQREPNPKSEDIVSSATRFMAPEHANNWLGSYP
jgi:hypothetical protein